MPVIKTIGIHDISFSEMDLPNDRLAIISSCLGALMLLFCWFLVDKSVIAFTVMYLVGFILLLPIGLGSYMGIFCTVKGYVITAACPKVDFITIVKTTPEADQIAICKSVQELEQKVLAYVAHKNELQVIAERCK